jgi:hypothetical protein
MATYKYLSDRNSDGIILGHTTTDLIAFYGSTPISQQTGAAQAAVATTAITTAAITTTTNSYGFATTTQANDLMTIVAANRTLLNEIRQCLIDLGFISGAA